MFADLVLLIGGLAAVTVAGNNKTADVVFVNAGSNTSLNLPQHKQQLLIPDTFIDSMDHADMAIPIQGTSSVVTFYLWDLKESLVTIESPSPDMQPKILDESKAQLPHLRDAMNTVQLAADVLDESKWKPGSAVAARLHLNKGLLEASAKTGNDYCFIKSTGQYGSYKNIGPIATRLTYTLKSSQDAVTIYIRRFGTSEQRVIRLKPNAIGVIANVPTEPERGCPLDVGAAHALKHFAALYELTYQSKDVCEDRYVLYDGLPTQPAPGVPHNAHGAKAADPGPSLFSETPNWLDILQHMMLPNPNHCAPGALP